VRTLIGDAGAVDAGPEVVDSGRRVAETDAAERRFERREGDVAEDDLAHGGPVEGEDAAPSAGQDGGAHGVDGASDSADDEEKHVVGEGTDAIGPAAAAWAA
jgi:hypothetical protein